MTKDQEDSTLQLVTSNDPHHPANLICELCSNFYNMGWATGTAGGMSIKVGNYVYLAPSGVQKERLHPHDIFVLDYPTLTYLREPLSLKPSACNPLFLTIYSFRGAGACIHTHSQAAVLCTLLTNRNYFQIANFEQIKAIPWRKERGGYMSNRDTLTIPIIENTLIKEDLMEGLEKAMDEYPDTCAVLVRRHGVYVWGDTVWKAKTQAESLDYLFQLAVEMIRLGLDPAGPISPVEA
ncbi:class II aldolase/adducin N-terminal [Kalaharituber pfeilii]|nr:class II aldolase/adducin N-terminal [Kalaharituber pfeilii]